MRPVNLIKKIIHDVLPDFNVFTEAIPPEYIDDLNVTQTLLKEATSTISTFGDNTFNQMDFGVDVQIFYAVDFDKDILETEIKLMQAFEAEGWRISDSQPHYLDLSSKTGQQQTIKNITVNKTMTLEEISES